MRFLVVFISLAVAASTACSTSRSATSPSQITEIPAPIQSPVPIVTSEIRDKTSCTLSISDAPRVKDLKLGMTTAEVLALFPGSNDDKELRSQLDTPVSEFGNSSFAITPSKYGSKEKFSGINQVAFGLLDGRVSSYTIGYNGPEFPHVDNFVATFVEGGKLPPADQWEPYAGLEHQLKILRCADFEVRVFAGGAGGSQNYIVMTDTEAVKKLKERRKKAREQATPAPGQ